MKNLETDIEIYKGEWKNNLYHGQGCEINKFYNFKNSFEWLDSLKPSDFSDFQIKILKNENSNNNNNF